MKRAVILAVILTIPMTAIAADQYAYKDGKRVKLTAEEVLKIEQDRQGAEGEIISQKEKLPVAAKKLKEIFNQCTTFACVKTAIANIDN